MALRYPRALTITRGASLQTINRPSQALPPYSTWAGFRPELFRDSGLRRSAIMSRTIRTATTSSAWEETFGQDDLVKCMAALEMPRPSIVHVIDLVCLSDATEGVIRSDSAIEDVGPGDFVPQYLVLEHRHIQTRQAIKIMDPGVEILRIQGACPTDAEWQVLGEHFTRVKNLFVDCGFCEEWYDQTFPLHWPLELLVIASACGHLVSTPAVIEGRISNLVLLYTSELGFQDVVPYTGGTAKSRPDEDYMESTAKELVHTVRETDALTITMPRIGLEWCDWKVEKHEGTTLALHTGPPPGLRPSRLKSLSIIENNAVTQFGMLAVASFHVVAGLESLTIRSTTGNDDIPQRDELFSQLLPYLYELKNLTLTLAQSTRGGPVGHYRDLWQRLPPNLEILCFRGPMALGSGVDGWVEALGNPDFLPRLKRLVFVLDLPFTDSGDHEAIGTATVEDLKTAKLACLRVQHAAENRGVVVEDFKDSWSICAYRFKEVDERWAGLELDE